LNDTNPIQEQNSNPRSVAKNSISGDKSSSKQQETTLEENFDKKTNVTDWEKNNTLDC